MLLQVGSSSAQWKELDDRCTNTYINQCLNVSFCRNLWGRFFEKWYKIVAIFIFLLLKLELLKYSEYFYHLG